MLLYNWKKIYETAEGNAFAVFLIFRMMATASVPYNKYDKIFKYAHINFSGESFLAHPDILLYNAYKYDYSEIAQYLALASLRPRSDYLATGKTTLDSILCTVAPELFKENRLLTTRNNQIYFLYEEVTKENIH